MEPGLVGREYCALVLDPSTARMEPGLVGREDPSVNMVPISPGVPLWSPASSAGKTVVVAGRPT